MRRLTLLSVLAAVVLLSGCASFAATSTPAAAQQSWAERSATAGGAG